MGVHNLGISDTPPPLQDDGSPEEEENEGQEEADVDAAAAEEVRGCMRVDHDPSNG